VSFDARAAARRHRAPIEVEIRGIRDRVRELVDEEGASNDVVVVGAFEIALRTVDDQLRVGGHEHRTRAERAGVGLLQARDVPARRRDQQQRKHGQRCPSRQRTPNAMGGGLIHRGASP
jgi:hypothetical protein